MPSPVAPGAHHRPSPRRAADAAAPGTPSPVLQPVEQPAGSATAGLGRRLHRGWTRWRNEAPGGTVSLRGLLLQVLAMAVLLILALGLAGSPARAADDDEAIDPPARVGRVARTEGWVTLQSHDTDEFVDSPRNWPLTTGDVVSTGDFAQAELRVGSSVFRIGDNARLSFVRLDDDAIELHLQRGSLALVLASDEAAREVTVSTPEGRFLPLGEGFFRIDATPTPGATAWRSGLQVDQASATFTLRPGQYAQLYPEGGWRLGTPVSDEFARWSMRPETPAPASETALLPAEMTGIEDLRDHGDWQRSDEWGMVWFPRAVAVDWAPYRVGRWAWVAPWGWTWVDDAPWGFAPFHYGRWVHWRGRWGWCPGEYKHRPVYSPALVVWADQPPPRSGVSITINIGRTMAWFPLAPREVYVPSYRASQRYVEVVNRPYLRQPVPRGDERRHDHGPRHIGTPPAYRYAQVETARSVLPRNLFEQARKPIDAVRRHEEPPRFRGQPPPREIVNIRVPDRWPDRRAGTPSDRPADRVDRGERGERGERGDRGQDRRDGRDERGAPGRPPTPAVKLQPAPAAPPPPRQDAPSPRPGVPRPQQPVAPGLAPQAPQVPSTQAPQAPSPQTPVPQGQPVQAQPVPSQPVPVQAVPSPAQQQAPAARPLPQLQPQPVTSPPAQSPQVPQPQTQPPALTTPVPGAPAPRRGERPGERPGERAGERPGERPGERLGERPVDDRANPDGRADGRGPGQRGDGRNDPRFDGRGEPRGEPRGRAPVAITPAPAAVTAPAVPLPPPAQPQVQVQRPAVLPAAPAAPAPAALPAPARPAVPAPQAPAAQVVAPRPPAAVPVPQAPATQTAAPRPPAAAPTPPAKPAPTTEPKPDKRPGAGIDPR